MTNKNNDNISDSDNLDELQQLSQRFIELWQQQLGIISDSMMIDNEIAKTTEQAHDNTRDKATTNAAHGATPAGAASLDVINILQQLPHDVKRLDRRITKIEQQIFSSKSTGKSQSTGKRSAKKPNAK